MMTNNDKIELTAEQKHNILYPPKNAYKKPIIKDGDLGENPLAINLKIFVNETETK